jgi:DNA-binding LacI/PurR family transcriptional regulator
MDDIEMSAYSEPPLTTVRVAMDEMGRLAAEWLIRLVEGKDGSAPPRPVPGHLVIRGTCGAAAGTSTATGAGSPTSAPVGSTRRDT